MNTTSDGDGVVDFPGLSRMLPGAELFLAIREPGTLGRYDAQGRYLKLPDLTAWVGDAVRRVIDERSAGSDNEILRLGVVTPASPSARWRSATLVFSDQVFRWFAKNEPEHLSPFELRNREKSIFQGMQVLLDCRNSAMPSIPLFCPVLHIRRRSGRGEAHLDVGRVGDIGQPDDELHVEVEVLNLIGPLSREERKAPWVMGLVHLIRYLAIFEDARHYDGLSM